ncbi:MAG: CPBP family intramembrane metalloprotease [Chloroflexi bacterium]|nr:CPBP family intramembrane metalloprotease [Chloroflexota bacterium]
MPAIRFSPLGYVRSFIADTRAALTRVIRDRAALAAILLFLLPWWSLIFLRDDTGWLESLGEIVAVMFLFWWMSRSGSAPAPEVKRPMSETFFAIALAFLWVEWRAAICSGSLFFLPAGFNCFSDFGFAVLPKLFDAVVFPFLILFVVGYGWRAQGVSLNLRAWWIALPVLLAIVAFGFYRHQTEPWQFVQRIGDYFVGAGLPEEFLFRAVLLTRLEAWWRSPGWALFGASAIFGLSHLAINYLVFTNRDWRETWIVLLTFQMGFGYAFAFAYQRTRNIWPIAVLHSIVDAL